MGRPKNEGRKSRANIPWIITKFAPKSFFSEQYRSIRTNIQFSKGNQSFRSITITSPNSGEGKSTVSSNLAVVFAQLGKKVLLVDSDMRKPVQHKIFRLSNAIGMSNVLSKQFSIISSIQETGINGLSVLTSGPNPHNPSELIASETMEEFLLAVYDYYDLVLFDTPPLMAVSDSQLLASITDASILVLRSESTEIKEAIQAVDVLLMAKGKFIGTILNKKRFPNINRLKYYVY
ncbi:CpsD/CapB family tyrosine-protein kinase [Caldibacillus lycopersici]|uniref:non-specific protein-tyrosine kinase n=1 Tax=Perspicuibacillus lycopersici TaxID=1325689 RepID=A0AAE3IPR7_9BACI|nr:CpsD/CapB family tyrosine-protein kinase [Perspicuibacillus lycopersici]MCU9612335.1 CpsD/CapB family tyrosine-protein kinase [Perspicuibacillus lycopersici]